MNLIVYAGWLATGIWLLIINNMFINIKVITNASKNQVIKKSACEFILKLTTTPVRGKANKKLIEVLAKYLNVKKSNILIVKGKYNSKKVLNIVK